MHLLSSEIIAHSTVFAVARVLLAVLDRARMLYQLHAHVLRFYLFRATLDKQNIESASCQYCA